MTHREFVKKTSGALRIHIAPRVSEEETAKIFASDLSAEEKLKQGTQVKLITYDDEEYLKFLGEDADKERITE